MSGSSFVLQGATLALAWFFAVNLAASAVAMFIAGRSVSRYGTSAGVWFWLRMFPAISAMVFVAAVFIPSYWRFEPRGTIEAIDATLIGAAIAGASIIALAIYRGIGVWRAAARRTREWMQSAHAIVLPGTTIPAFEIDADAPVLALAGIVRPRLLVTRGLLAALTCEELEASIAHEIGHSRAADNLKRLMMRSAPDFFGLTSAARMVERRWAAAAEHRADRISEHQPAARCALAAALVKVARLTPAATPLGEPISTLIGGGDITSRVRNLLDDGAGSSTAGIPTGHAVLGTTAAVLAAVVLYAPTLRVVHEATEVLVRMLP